jgi:hypothetical protein
MRNNTNALNYLLSLDSKTFKSSVQDAGRRGWSKFICGREVFYFKQVNGIIKNFH